MLLGRQPCFRCPHLEAMLEPHRPHQLDLRGEFPDGSGRLASLGGGSWAFCVLSFQKLPWYVESRPSGLEEGFSLHLSV